MTNPETRAQIEAEFIGWMMANTSEIVEIGGITPEVFSDPLNQEIAKIIINRAEQNQLVNPLIVRDILAPVGEEADIIPKYLAACVGKALACIWPREHLMQLTKYRRLDAINEVCEKVARESASEEAEPEAIASLMIDSLNQVLEQATGVNFKNSKEVSELVLEDMKSIPPVYSTGIVRLDENMGGGLFAGKSYGVAAKKKVGKTITASTISCNLDLAGVPHLFICGEMSDREIHQRTLSRLAGVYPSVFRNQAEATGPMLSRIASASFRLTGSTKYLNAPGLTFEQLRRAVATAVSRYGIKGFILDYWQLVGGKAKNKSTSEHLDEVAQWIADYCREKGLWSLTMAQINQEGNTRGGEGMRLAFDQVYHMQPCNDDIEAPERWFEMMDTRYTKWQDIGTANQSPLRLNEKGPYLEELAA